MINDEKTTTERGAFCGEYRVAVVLRRQPSRHRNEQRRSVKRFSASASLRDNAMDE